MLTREIIETYRLEKELGPTGGLWLRRLDRREAESFWIPKHLIRPLAAALLIEADESQNGGGAK